MHVLLALILSGLAFLAPGVRDAAQDDDTATATKPALAVELEQHPFEWQRGTLLVRFRNTSDAPVTILRPLDGSMYGWFMPAYRFGVVDADGVSLELPGRCGVRGLWADTRWPESFRLTIPAGSTATMRLSLPY